MTTKTLSVSKLKQDCQEQQQNFFMKMQYSDNNIRKEKNQDLNIVCQNLIGQFHEFRTNVLRFY